MRWIIAWVAIFLWAGGPKVPAYGQVDLGEASVFESDTGRTMLYRLSTPRERISLIANSRWS
jgi:hypothetical protein